MPLAIIKTGGPEPEASLRYGAGPQTRNSLSLASVRGKQTISSMPLAIIKTGGKQYIVSPGDKIKIEKLPNKEGEQIEFTDVLILEKNRKLEIGQPLVKEAKISAKVLKQGKADKVIIFKYKAKKRYKKKTGHRQPYTEVEITKI